MRVQSLAPTAMSSTRPLLLGQSTGRRDRDKATADVGTRDNGIPVLVVEKVIEMEDSSSVGV